MVQHGSATLTRHARTDDQSAVCLEVSDFPQHRAARVLLVATPGGHFEELRMLCLGMHLETSEVHWATSASPQTESLLDGQKVHWLRPIASGEVGKAALTIGEALRIHRIVRPDLVVSTGAAAASPHLVAAALSGCRIWYVESATRLMGPSRTGQLAQRLPRTSLFVQGDGWGDPRWQSIADVFSRYEVGPADVEQLRDVQSVVVTLGTERYPFERAVSSAQSVLGGRRVFWQTGSTSAVVGGRELQRMVPSQRLREACRTADVIITHGGIGSVLMALELGKVPVVLPRSHRLGEHIDDHQLELCGTLSSRGLAVTVLPHEELTVEHLREAQASRVSAAA